MINGSWSSVASNHNTKKWKHHSHSAEQILSPRFTNLIQHSLKPKLALKCNHQIGGVTLPGISTLCTQIKQTQCLPLFLQDVTTNDYWLLQGDHGRSFFAAVFLGGQMNVHTCAFLFAHHLFSHCVREACLPTNLLSPVGNSWSWLPHQSWQKSYKHWNHSLSNFSYRWGRGEKAGADNCFLQNWSSKGGTFRCTFDLNPGLITWLRCSSGEDVH